MPGGGAETDKADAPAMAATMARPVLAALALLCLATPAAAVEVCKVVDLQLVTQTGEFFLAGAPPPRPAAEVAGRSEGESSAQQPVAGLACARSVAAARRAMRELKQSACCRA